MIVVVKEFGFEAAHQLCGYNGKCANIHGHSYRLAVSVGGNPQCDPRSSCYGMVMDFAELRKIVQDYVISVFDHSLILLQTSTLYTILKDAGIRIVSTPYQPTCENMLMDIVARLHSALPQELCLVRVKLWETVTSYAEWNEGI